MPFREHLPDLIVLIVAFAAFLGVKLVGYAGACVVLRKAFPDTATGAWRAASIRVALGVAFGLMYIALWSLLSLLPIFEHGGGWVVALYHLGLFGVRAGAWWSLYHFAFPGALRERKRGFVCAIVGSLWSTALDLPAWVALSLTYGWLICF
ncbi:MAG: hypothetical protein ACAI25_20595 [Planctomycetota bacterium]